MQTVNGTMVLGHEQVAKICWASRHGGGATYVEGETGIGKSALLATLREWGGDSYSYAYFDMASKDLIDMGLPTLMRDANEGKGLMKFVPNSNLMLHTGKPVVIMFDEWSKAMRPTQMAAHTALEEEPRIGDVHFPEGSIIILTGNLAAEGLGDQLQAHTRNRVTKVIMRKPSSEEWVNNYAIPRGKHPIVTAFADQRPDIFASFLDGPDVADNNPLIWNPKQPRRGNGAFLSPRSLAKAADRITVSEKDGLDPALVKAQMQGDIGLAAAQELDAYVAYYQEIPSYDDIIDSPASAKVPDGAGARSVMVFSILTRIRDVLEAEGKSEAGRHFISTSKYIDRLGEEWKAVYFRSAAGVNAVKTVAFSSPVFKEWALQNMEIL